MIKNLFLSLAVFFLSSQALKAQCTFPSTISDVTLQCTGTQGTRTGLAYNPNQSLYYSVNGGASSYSLETFAVTGGSALNTVAQGVDYRGYWWNPITGLPEGNTFNAGGLYSNSLDGSFYATGTANFIGAASMPDQQSCGAGDIANNQIIYYNSGIIYKYNRSTGALISNITITGLPVPTGNIAIYGCGFTGVPGSEVVIYDNINKDAYFINYNTGAYVSTCDLPASAPTSIGYGISCANNRLFVFDQTLSRWIGYPIVNSTCVGSALNFRAGSGTSNYVHFGTPASWWNLGSNFTLEMWIKPNTTANQILLYAGYGCITCPQWVLGIGPEVTCGYGGTSGRIVFTTAMGAKVESDANPPTGVWTHVAITYNGDIMKMYVNGLIQQSTSRIIGSIPNPTYMEMGRDPELRMGP